MYSVEKGTKWTISHTLLQANSIYMYDCELEGAICHMAPSCEWKLLQSVNLVGAKRCHLANGTFFHKENKDFSNGIYEFCYFLVKKSKFKFSFFTEKKYFKTE